MILNPEEYDLWIDKHLRGELTEEEKITFERVSREEEGFRQRVTAMKEIQAGIRQSVLEEKWALLEQWDDEMVGDPDALIALPTGEHNTRLLVWLATAAVVFLGTILMWPDDNRALVQEYAYYFNEGFETLIKHETLRPGDYTDPYNKNQREAYSLFAAQQFEAAIPKLQTLWDTQRDSLALEYLGWCYLWKGDKEKGEKILNN